MSKVSFRTRQIDFNKPLPIIKCEDGVLSDFHEYAAINRGVPQMPTGMEKEEEAEHHLQEALNALQQFRSTSIPIPEIVENIENAGSIYTNHSYVPPKHFIHIQSFLLEDEQPADYDMDSEDEEWLQKSDLEITPLQFETLIDKLEKGCGHKVMSLDEARALLKEDPSLVIAVYDYWLTKRVKSRQPMILTVKQEKRDGSNSNDAYVAFRRRTEKMQTRKNRKNDEQSYEKMVRLKLQMQRLGDIVSNILKRDKTKYELTECKQSIFKKRYTIGDWDGWMLKEAEALIQKQRPLADSLSDKSRDIDDLHLWQSPAKRRRGPVLYHSNDLQSVPEPDLNPDGQYTFIRRPGCFFRKPRDMFSPLSPSLLYGDRSKFQLTTLNCLVHSRRGHTTGYLRRRIGRGGRIIYDRVVAEDSAYLDTLSSESDEEQSVSAQHLSGKFCPRKLPRSDSVSNSTLPSSLDNTGAFSIGLTNYYRQSTHGINHTHSLKSSFLNGNNHSNRVLEKSFPKSKEDLTQVKLTSSSTIINSVTNGPNRSNNSIASQVRPICRVPSIKSWNSSNIEIGTIPKTLGCHPFARQTWTTEIMHDTSEELT